MINNTKKHRGVFKKMIKKLTIIYFQIGVNVIGLPQFVHHVKKTYHYEN